MRKIEHCCDTYFRVEICKTVTRLRSHVVGCVAGRHQHPVVRSQLFRESEIADANRLRIPRVVRVQDVRRLQIPATGWEGVNFFPKSLPASA